MIPDSLSRSESTRRREVDCARRVCLRLCTSRILFLIHAHRLSFLEPGKDESGLVFRSPPGTQGTISRILPNYTPGHHIGQPAGECAASTSVRPVLNHEGCWSLTPTGALQTVDRLVYLSSFSSLPGLEEGPLPSRVWRALLAGRFFGNLLTGGFPTDCRG
jgi:hypothetical protein